MTRRWGIRRGRSTTQTSWIESENGDGSVAGADERGTRGSCDFGGGYRCAATSTAAGAKEKYEEKVIRKTRRMGADLIEYDGVTGTWRFAINL